MDNHANPLRTLILVFLLATLLTVCVPIGPAGNARAYSFSEASQGFPTDGDFSYIAKGDFNGDGHIDIASGSDSYGGTPSPYGLYVWLGDGNGKWSGSSSGLPDDNTFGGIDSGDIDGDGDLDLVAGYETWSGGEGLGIGVWLNDGSASWSDGTKPIDSGGYDSAVLSDIDLDGNLDIIGASRGSGIKVWLGDGTGKWTEKICSGLPTEGENTGVAVGDPDDDGDMDIAAGNYHSSGIQFWANDGSFGFKEQSQGLHSSDNSFSVAFADMDKDSNLDLLGTVRGRGVFVWLGNGGQGGAMSWTESREGLPAKDRYKQLDVADIEGDGNLDIAAARPGGGLHVWKGNGGEGGTLSFIEETGDLPSDGTYYGVGLADINEDSVLDIVGATWDDGINAFITTVGPQDTTPPSAISDLRVNKVTSNSVTLKWTATGDDGTDGTATNYIIKYSKDGSLDDESKFNSAFDSKADLEPKESGSDESFTISGLSGDTTYHFALKATDDALNYVLSNSVEAKTEPVPDDTEPPTLSITSPSPHATVDGTVSVVVTFDDPDGMVNSLEFSIDGEKWESISLSGVEKEYSWKWNTLDPGRTIENGEHTIKVVAADIAGHTAEAVVTVEVDNQVDDGGEDDGDGSPGFEFIICLGALLSVAVFLRKRYH